MRAGLDTSDAVPFSLIAWEVLLLFAMHDSSFNSYVICVFNKLCYAFLMALLRIFNSVRNIAMTTDGANDGFEYHRFERHYTERPNVTESRLRLLWAALTTKVPGRTLSIGAGTGDVEEALRERYGFTVDEIVEPSDALFPAILGKGFHAWKGIAEEYPYEPESFDTIYYNGSSHGFIDDENLEPTFRKNYDALRPGGRLILSDVPKESTLGILLLTVLNHPELDRSPYADLLSGTAFFDIAQGGVPTYKPNWHVTTFYIDLLERIGFTDLRFRQTVLANSTFQNDAVEDPIPGYTQGNYVAIIATKPVAER